METKDTGSSDWPEDEHITTVEEDMKQLLSA